jgi:hypothetical protein
MLLSIALQPNRLLINLPSPLSQFQDRFTPPYKIKNQCHSNVYLLGHLRAPCLPIRNPRIPTAVNEQRYLNESMINCDALMICFYEWGVAGLCQGSFEYFRNLSDIPLLIEKMKI